MVMPFDIYVCSANFVRTNRKSSGKEFRRKAETTAGIMSWWMLLYSFFALLKYPITVWKCVLSI